MTPAAMAMSQRVQLMRSRRRVALLVLFSLLLVVVQVLAWPLYRLSFNTSESLPGHLYMVQVGVLPAKGDYVAVRPPKNRFFPAWLGFLKQVRGVAGDVVAEHDRKFSINGEELAYAKPQSLKGVPLQAGPVGTLPPGHYWVWTPHPDSFDSRYADVGWIDQSRVIGRAIRLL